MPFAPPVAPAPHRSPSRLAALRSTGLLEGSLRDNRQHRAFDDLARLARDVAGASCALVTLVADDRTVVLGAHGVGAPAPGRLALPGVEALGIAMLESGGPIVVRDAHTDRGPHAAAVGAAGLAAWVGLPIVAAGGHVLAMLAVADIEPRAWDERALAGVEAIARLAGAELDHRREATEHRAAQAKLAESEQQLRTTQDIAQLGSWQWEAESGRLHWSARLCELFGVGADAVPPDIDGFIGMMHPGDREEALRLVMRAFTHGEPFAFDHRVLRPDGTIRHLHCRCQVERDTAGRTTRMRGSTLDVTDRKEAELALRASEEQFRALSAASPIVIFRADLAGRIQYMNPRTEQLWGAPAAQLMGSGWIERVHPDDRAALSSGWAAALGEGREFEHAYRIVRPDGSTRHVHGRSAPLRDAGGALVGAVGTVEDVTEVRESEYALRASERRFRQMAESIDDVFWLGDAEANRPLYVNAAFERLWGIPAQTYLANPAVIIAHIHPDDLASAFAGFDMMLMGGPVSIEFRIVRPDHSVRWVRSRSFPLHDRDGTSARRVGITTDITAQKVAEGALRESEARYADLAANIPGMVYQFAYRADGSAGYTFVSEGARTLFGVAPETALRDPGALLRLIHPDDFVEFRDVAREAATTLEPFRWEGRVVLACGEERIIEVAARARPVAQGGVVSDGVVLDVTDSRRAAEQLAESEARLRLAVGAAGMTVWERDLEPDRLRDVAQSQAEVAQRGGATEPGEYGDFLAAVHPDDRLAVMKANAEAVATLGTFAVEYRSVRADATVRWNQTHGRVLADVAGRATRMIGVSRDVTDRVQLEAQLRQAQKMEAVGRLAGGIAHDFNNLLMVIGGSSNFVREALQAALPPGAPALQDLTVVDAAVDRATRLTHQLLAFSRKQVLRPRVLDLNDVVHGLAPMLRRLIGEDIAVLTYPAAGLRPVLADPGQLEQVLVNLVVNARDAMPSGGRLVIETANVDSPAGEGTHADEAGASRGFVRLVVRDSGVGMDEATRARVFEPFFTTKAPGQGTGLGLATVYGIIRQSGGHISLQSAPGAGTTFTIDLPATDAAHPAECPVEEMPSIRIDRPGSVLLVEDEPSVRSLVRRMLERQGLTVLEAGTGEEALALADRHAGPIDVALTDVVMPEMSGRALAEALARRHPGVRVIFMSGYTDDEILRRGLLTPGMRFIEKPFETATLLKAVRGAMER